MLDKANQVLDLKGKTQQQSGDDKKKSNNNANQVEEEKVIDDKDMLNFLTNKMKEMETEYDLIEHLVIDMGSAYTKIGFSGEDLPKYIIPSIYGSLKDDKDNKEDGSFEMK
jgi:hypothetical protein